MPIFLNVYFNLLLVISIGYPDVNWKKFDQPKELTSFVKYN